MILQELSRQSYVHCAERGLLLEYIRLQLNHHTNSLQREALERDSEIMTLHSQQRGYMDHNGQASPEGGALPPGGRGRERRGERCGKGEEAPADGPSPSSSLARQSHPRQLQAMAQLPVWGAPGVEELTAQLQAAVEELTRREEMAASALESQSAEDSRRRGEYSALESEIRRLEERAGEQDSVMARERSVLEDVEEELAQYRSAAIKTQNKCENLADQMDILTQELRATKLSLGERDRELAATKHELEKAEASLSSQRGELADAVQTMSQLDKEVEGARTEQRLALLKPVDPMFYRKLLDEIEELHNKICALERSLEENGLEYDIGGQAGQSTLREDQTRRPTPVCESVLETELRREIDALSLVNGENASQLDRLLDLVDSLGEKKANKQLYKAYHASQTDLIAHALAVKKDKPDAIRLKERVVELECKNQLLTKTTEDQLVEYRAQQKADLARNKDLTDQIHGFQLRAKLKLAEIEDVKREPPPAPTAGAASSTSTASKHQERRIGFDEELEDRNHAAEVNRTN